MRTITLLLPVVLVLHFCQGRPQVDVQSAPPKQYVHASDGYKFKFAVYNETSHSTIDGTKPTNVDEDISKSNLTAQVDSEYTKHDLAYDTDKGTNGANITTQFSPELAKQTLSESNEDTDERIGTTLLISLSGTG